MFTRTGGDTKAHSPLQLGHAVQLIVVAASEALRKRIILDLQLRNLRTKHIKPFTPTLELHHRTLTASDKCTVTHI